MSDLESIITACLPASLVNRAAFDDFFEDIKQSVQPAAMGIVAALGGILKRESQSVKDHESPARDCWWLFGDEQPVKSSPSARSKLARELDERREASGTMPARLTEDQLNSRILNFTDLGRCRIVCTFNRDAAHLLSVLVANGLFLGKYQLRDPVKDFIFDPDRRDGLKGHRARQFSVWAPTVDGGEFGFEVQLMTVLQHAWDRRNHPLYEWAREGNDLPTELKVNDFACAEALHLVDQQADRNWEAFLEHTRTHNTNEDD